MTKFLAILGPDGAGKSTLLNGITEKLRQNEKSVLVVYGSKKSDQFFLITKISYFFYEQLALKIPISKKFNLFAHIYLLFFHYFIELLDNYFKYRRIFALSDYDFVLFDRYPYDRFGVIYTFDQTQSYADVAKSVLRFLMSAYQSIFGFIYIVTLPKLDSIYCLDTSPDLLFERKPEHYGRLTIASASYQKFTLLYKMLMRRFSDCVKIGASEEFLIRIPQNEQIY